MASGGSNVSVMSERSDSSFEEHRGRYCAICYHRYARDGSSVPRILTCGHSFCTGCLERLIGNVLRGYIRCPACKRDTMIPGLTNEVSKLAKNFGVLDLLESIDEEKSATAAAAAVLDPIPICNEHENEPKKVYCLTDSEIICIYCQVYGGHNGHDCQLISKLAQEYRQVLRSKCEGLLAKKESIVGAKTVVNDTASAVCFKEEKIMREITHHFEMLRRKLHRREAQVKALLKNRTSAKVMLLDKQKRTISEMIHKCDEQYEACQNILSGPDHEVVLQKNKLQSDIETLASQVDMHDASPCTRDDLLCQLETDITDRITNHGNLVKDSKKGIPVPELNDDSSTPSGEGSLTPGSDTTGETSEDQDIEWQELNYLPSGSTPNRSSPRRRLEVPDVIILEDDDMELEQVNNNVPVQQAARATGGGGDMTCGGCGSPHRAVSGEQKKSYRAQKRSLHTSSPGRQSSRRARSGETTTSEESPDLSDLSDMELDLSIRSAWSNVGGWSASQDNLVGAVGGATLTETTSPMRSLPVLENSNRQLQGDDLGSRPSSSRSSGGQGRRSDPWEVAAPQRRCRSGGSHPRPSSDRPNPDMKCSVFNCSTGASSFYVKCKNCTRLFCQRCTSSSISARRCYKRPRGHSFVFLPCNSGNSSANNNQVPQRQRLVPFAIQLGGSGDGAQLSTENGWHCTNCSTLNRFMHRSRTCLRCGRQSRVRAEGQRQEGATNNRHRAKAAQREQSDRSAAVTESVSENTAASEEVDSAAGGDEPPDVGQAQGAEGGVEPQNEGRQQAGGQAAAAAASSGISSSTVSSNDSGYENVCPACATVNAENAMRCASCSAQLFL